jgi:hypothetical protein
MPATGIFHRYLSGLRYHAISDPLLPQRRFEDHVRSLLRRASFSLRAGRTPAILPENPRGCEVSYSPHIRAVWKPGPISFGIECLLFRQWPEKGPEVLMRTLVLDRRSRWSAENGSPLYFVLGSQVPDHPCPSPVNHLNKHHLLLLSLAEVRDAVRNGSRILVREHPWNLPFSWNGNGLC